MTLTPRHRRTSPPFALAGVALIAVSAWLVGCESGMRRIDRNVDQLLSEATGDLDGDSVRPDMQSGRFAAREVERSRDLEDERPSTRNPAADDLQFVPLPEDDNVMARLEGYDESNPDAVTLDLNGALAYAVEHSREFRFAEEDYVLAALQLLIERHRWGPRFFDEVSATASANGDGSAYDSSLRVVNDFSITQRLPYGGEVAVRALANAVEDLHQRVAGEDVQDATVIISADIPLLRGSGLAARNSRIQAERNVVYAARDFEQFRRQFLFDIANDFLNLVVQRLRIRNAERQLESFEYLERRQHELVAAGRVPPFEEALAAQDTLFARDSLAGQREFYRVAVDRFKVRVGMPTSDPVVIDLSMPKLPPPEVTPEGAVLMALKYRLDLQNSRDRVDDSRRGVLVARNATLPDLNLSASASMPTDPTRDRGGVDIDPNYGSYSAGVTFGLPLDREIEQLGVRQSEIDLERSVRSYDNLRDGVAVDVRSAIRDIDRARFSLQLQEQNITIAQRRQASIDAAPDRATARDQSEALDQYLRAQDDRDSALRDLQIAILRYLLETGQLRVDADGTLHSIAGMPEMRGEPLTGDDAVTPDTEGATAQPAGQRATPAGAPPAPEADQPAQPAGPENGPPG